jgi:hypothetical protein
MEQRAEPIESDEFAVREATLASLGGDAGDLFASLVENSSEFISIATLAGGVLYVNEAGRALVEAGTLDDVRRTTATDYFAPDDEPYVREVITPALQRDGRWSGDFRLRNFRSGSTLAVWHTVFYIRDTVTKRPIAIATVSADTRERTHSEHRLRTLVEAGATLSHSLDYSQTLANLADLVVRNVATFCVIDILRTAAEGGAIERIVAVHADPERHALMAQIVTFEPSFEQSEHPVILAFVEGVSTLIAEVDDGWIERVASSPEHALAVRALGIRSLITVPLVSGGEVLGALTCALGEERRKSAHRPEYFDAEDQFFIEELGRRGGAAIENARMYERERRIAVSLQEASLPRTLPRYGRLHLAAEYRPGKGDATIGGDWYDAFLLDDGRVVLAVGDVLGNGLNAAISMTKLRQVIAAAAMLAADPNVMLDVADKTLRLHDGDVYATAIAAIYDPIEHALTFASAGHPGPMLRTPDGRVEELSSPGLLLGMRTGKDRRVKVVAIPPGSTIVFYTDGLTEATRNIDEGQARLGEALARLDLAREINPARALVDAVLRGEDASDDIAVLVARVASLGEAPASSVQTTYSGAPASLA